MRALQPPTQTLEHVLGSDPAVVRGFARAVSDQLSDGPLSLHHRDRLIARGARLGLKRFDANLVIAAMEQRTRPSLRLAQDDDPERPLPRWLRWLVAGSVQAMVVLGAWALLA